MSLYWTRLFSLTFRGVQSKLIYQCRGIRVTATCCQSKFYSTTPKPDYFVTTPIFYVNASPHIGHLYTVLLADVLSRWHQLKGDNVLFSTGTDEHGLKIQQAANKNDQHPTEFCNLVSQTFVDLFKEANVNHTDFIRTTEKRHITAVQHFWMVLESKGYIYKGGYEGWYSVSDEAFMSESDVKDIMIDGKTCKVSVESEQPVIWMEEENYMFRLSKFKDKIHDWLDTGVIHPKNFEQNVRNMLTNLTDLSISRQSDRLTWGIPVPNDPTQTIYVWLDALVNYLTVTGYPNVSSRWPPDCQIIGKDILRFHAVYWPAFLMAAGLELPKKLLCHSHWTVDDTKMSKSIGNVVNPIDKMNQFSIDGLRYFLLRVGVPHLDGNYSDVKAVECINSELVNVLGNLLNRCTSLTINLQQVWTGSCVEDIEKFLSPADQDKFHSLEHLADVVDRFYTEFSVYKALQKLTSQLHWTNAFVEHHKPWQLVKSEQSLDHLNVVLHVIMVTLRNCGILLQPVIPNIANKLLNRLNVPVDCRTFENAKELSLDKKTRQLGKDNSVLLKRIKI
ncbi:hypothetical protein SNE40_000819 [Patella caerulea]|uniref:Methionine--tRNA ligase, mitochondrial n=1 Tax=Patella caerulea TaxID=87958 RepID=A0AAN8Q2Q8_PATCE